MSPSPRSRFASVFRAFLAAALCLALPPAGPGVRRAYAAVSTLDIYTDALAAVPVLNGLHHGYAWTT